ncbi:Uncharacterized protein FWK35_00038048 [Aphis craccivora]|uniref:Uncharacterized protein n=1 Tax=Aphis craccivora TaxID=307492 RepID=A0A6G0YJJ3_APHCR|nr:Uncharacterized protein FWK35_00038048 [Aphis craccivora]
MQIKNQLESFENLIFSNNIITSHNVNLNAASVLKSGYSFVVSALEKFFDKGLPPPNSIQVSNSSNSNINQTYWNNTTINVINNSKINCHCNCTNPATPPSL